MRAAHLLILSLVLPAASGPAWGQDIVQQIVGLVPSQPHSYSQMLVTLAALERSERVTLMRLGRSVEGRELVGVAVHSPRTVFGQGRRLFVIARQHGNEVSGTEAVLALVRHFATSQGALERGTLEHVTIVAVPMSNPDGAERGRRANARGVDLNRDWLARSQPETAAIERAVRAWQPHALIDLHELPRSTPKPAYADSFVETIGAGPGVPQYVSAHSHAAALDMATWLRAYNHHANVYYGGAQKDRRLCHRHFGLNHNIPSFLLEVKTGPGRTMAHRVSFHVLGMLVVANYLMHCGDIGPAPTAPAPQAALVASLPQPAIAPAAATGPVSVTVSHGPREGDVVSGLTHIEAAVTGGEQVRYVRYKLNGQLWLISNMEPYRAELDTLELEDGPTEVTIEAVGVGGHALARATRTFRVDNSALAGR